MKTYLSDKIPPPPKKKVITKNEKNGQENNVTVFQFYLFNIILRHCPICLLWNFYHFHNLSLYPFNPNPH
jgi:hypothetical protein